METLKLNIGANLLSKYFITKKECSNETFTVFSSRNFCLNDYK